MSKILTGTGSTGYPNIQIERACQKIGIIATVADVASLDTVLFSVLLSTKNGGSRTILPNIPLSHIMEIAASNEGCLQLIKNGDKIEVRGTVELSNTGALDIQDGYLEVGLTGCVATDSYSLFSIDNGTLTPWFIDYQTTFVNQNSTKEINVDGFYQLCVPKSIKQLDLEYLNGRTVSYCPEELDLVCQEINEIAVLDNTAGGVGSLLVTGSNKYFCLGLFAAKTAKILQSSGENVYLVKARNLAEV